MTRPTLRLGVAALTAAGMLALAACGASVTPSADSSSAAPPTSAAPVPLTHVFAPSSPWNTRADTATVDPDSRTLLKQAGERMGVAEHGSTTSTDFRTIDDRLWINSDAWTVPVADGGVPTRITCREADCGDGSVPLTLDVPQGLDPDPRYDGWFTIVDASQGVAYDLWRGRRLADGSISAQYIRKWSLDGTGFGQSGQTAVRGSGLPLIGGLVTADELASGTIDHALAISVPGASSSTFVSPATATDGVGRPTSLPEGARIRLKADVVPPRPVDPTTGKPLPLTAEQQRTADAITAALRTYGAIVVDRSAVPSLYIQRGVATTSLAGGELSGLHLSDFEVLTLPPRQKALQ
jgi:hypothetical protein